MQTSNRLLDDLARVASGAASTVAGLKGEIDSVVRQRMERLLSNMDWIPRDEFNAVKAMAAKARAEQEKLSRRVAELEARLGQGSKKKPGKKPTKAKAKAKAKSSAARAKARPKSKAKKSAGRR